VTVRRAPSSYVLGNAPGGAGWTFDSETARSGWSYGYLYGDYNGCSWIQSTHLYRTGTTGNHYCSASGTTFPMRSFAILKNSTPSNDGYPVSTIAATTEYANVDPMGSIAARDPIRAVPAGYQVRWRYVTLDSQFVMVRDPNVATGDGNWIFVPRSALPNPLPKQTGV